VSEKQIFAALEIADHEVRLIVGEFFNTRFNIIKVERVPVTGLVFN
jgi:cell division protein FtsA